MGDQAKTDRIAELRRELAELEAQDRGDRVPTLAEIKDMSPERIEVELQRLAKGRAGVADDASGAPAKATDRPVPEPTGTARIAAAYGASAAANAKRASEGDR